MKTEKSDQFERIAEALERLAPKKKDFPDFDEFSAFMWHVAPDYLEPVEITNAIDISLLRGIDQVSDILLFVIYGSGSRVQKFVPECQQQPTRIRAPGLTVRALL